MNQHVENNPLESFTLSLDEDLNVTQTYLQIL